MPEHILIVGYERHFPSLIRAVCPDATITNLCRVSAVPSIREPTQNDRIIALRDEAHDEEWLAFGRAIHMNQPLTRIGAFGELDQNRAAAIAATLKLSFHSRRTIDSVYNKYRMRTRLREAGLDDTPAAQVSTVHQLQAFLTEYGPPCVVKPNQGAGSYGINIIRDPQETEVALERSSRSYEVTPVAGALIEKFHEGPQFSIEAFSEGGTHEFLMITRKFSDPTRLVEVGHVAPAALSADQAQDIHDYVRRALDALGITYGPTHTEIVLTAGGPRIIETHVREGGGGIPDLVKAATGVDLADCTARQLLGEAVLPRIRKILDEPVTDSRVQAIWFAIPRALGGELECIQGIAEASSVPGVIAVQTLLDKGAQIGNLESGESRGAFVHACGDHETTALTAARKGVGKLQFIIRAPADTTSELL